MKQRTAKWIGGALLAGIQLAVQLTGCAQEQGPLRKATDAEVLAGSAVRAFVTPDQLTLISASGPTNGITSSTATNISQGVLNQNTNNYVPRLNGTSTGQTLTNALITSNTTFQLVSPLSAPNAYFFRHESQGDDDSFIIAHGGSEFFLGITNGDPVHNSYIDANINGEFEFNLPAGQAYRFYSRDSGGADTAHVEINDSGAWANLLYGGGLILTNGMTNLSLAAAPAHTNVIIVDSNGNFGTNDINNFGGGGITFPPASDLDFGGKSATNGNNFQAATLSFNALCPFTNWTRFVIVGDSRGLAPDLANCWPTWLASNILVKLPYYAGMTNCCVSGQTLEQESNLYSSVYSLFKPSGGTNAVIILSGGYNDAFFGTNSALSLLSMSNLFYSSKADNFFVVGIKPWTGGKALPVYEQNLPILQDYVGTNLWCDVQVDFGDSWDSKTSAKITTDGTHPNYFGAKLVANAIWEAILRHPGYPERISTERHFPGNVDIFMKNDVYTVRGLSMCNRVISDFPGWLFESTSGSGGAGEILQIGRFMNFYAANGTANLTNVMTLSDTNALVKVPLSVSGTISAPTNTANFNEYSSVSNTCVFNAVYTNGPTRSLLVGEGWLHPTVGDQANIILYYTNNAVGHRLEMIGDVVAADYIVKTPFCIPLSPGGTFLFSPIFPNLATGFITNTVLNGL